MMHLIPYKLFESTSNKELELDVKDIFIELQDKGFEVEVDLRPQGVDMFSVSICRNNLFSYKDVKEQFERTKDYLEQNSWMLEKIIASYYPKGAFNDHGTKVLNRMRTEKFSGFNFDFFTLFADSLSEDGSALYEVTFIFNPN